MTEFDASSATPADLLKVYAQTLEALRKRGLMRSSNAPTGDFAEYLFCKAFGWERQVDSATGFDAKDSLGKLYLIRGKRITRYSQSREVPAIRDLKNRPFDILAAVLFHDDFSVSRAALIPIEVVDARSSYSDHVGGWRFLLADSVWETLGVIDVTFDVRKAAESA